MASRTHKQEEIGRIATFYAGVGKIQGLPTVQMHEVLKDGSGDDVALVIGYDDAYVDALFFREHVELGQALYRTGEIISVPVTPRVKGRVLDAFGAPRDGRAVLRAKKRPAFVQAPPIIARQPVHVPLITGIKVIDVALPIGRGQRELIIGDRKLGKSTIGEDVVLNQAHADPAVTCIYVVCGKTQEYLNELASLFEAHDAFTYTVIVAATADDPYAAKYLAPFTGCAIAEYFRDQGMDTLVIYDDLSKHAKAYRDIALLLERAPGREAYPGDIFSLHAGLLERAASLSEKEGGGTMTALPIIETEEGDITSFIPTNLISITDGQIYLERGLFQKGFLPAVNVGLSVSRVGSQAQPPALRDVTKGIRLALSQENELQKLTQLESVASKKSMEKIERGRLMLELLKQDKRTFVSFQEQVVLFHTVMTGMFDDQPADQWPRIERLVIKVLRTQGRSIISRITKGTFDDEVKQQIADLVKNFKEEFLSTDTKDSDSGKTDTKDQAHETLS